MARATLTIDLDALIANWRTLDALTAPSVATAAAIKADAYGYGASPVARALLWAGVKQFFVAQAEEGAQIRAATGPEPEIFILSGYLPGDRDLCRDNLLTPVLNSAAQADAFLRELPGNPCALQLDTGLNRLGMDEADLTVISTDLPSLAPNLILSHLACADEPAHPLNARQLAEFTRLTARFPGIRRSLAATGGAQIGPEYHFDMIRTGIGVYGGAELPGALPVATLTVPVIQINTLKPGETVGYSATWTAKRPSKIATLSAGYADGFMRALSGKIHAYADGIACPLVGRISMDLIGVDVTDLKTMPSEMELINHQQTINTLAEAAGTISYEIITSLGPRLARVYTGGPAH